MNEPTPESFLRLIRRRSRGRLKVYLGYAPGVGKTYQMLLEGHRLRDSGVDVVIGYVENHGRADTQSLCLGLEEVPRRSTSYRGIRLEEMDVDGVLARKPEVALVDELAHTNAPGSRNDKRWRDVLELLAAGVSVLTTLNVQHLESLYDTVERLVGVKVKERVPDWVLAEADQVVNVDLTTDDLEQRMRQGKIYPVERIAASLASFFRPEKLAQLRELTLREAASQVQKGTRQEAAGAGIFVPDQVVVCLSSKGPDAAALLRYGSRLAGRLDRNWYALYVQTPAEEPTRIDATTQRYVSDTLALAHELGATVFTFKGGDVAETILRFAAEHGAGHVVVGRPGRKPWWRRLFRRRGPVEELLARAEGYAVVVVDPRAALPVAAPALPAEPPAVPSARLAAPSLAQLLDPRAVLFFDQPVAKQELLERLVSRLAALEPALDADRALRRLERREREGSTFLSEGIGLPHARIPNLPRSLVALAVLTGDPAPPVEVVVLLLCPEEEPAICLELMSQCARLFRDEEIRHRLRRLHDGEALIREVRAWRSRSS